MVERPADRIETVFEEYGSLPKPGFMGRLVRLGFGVWLLWVLYILITDGWQGLVDTTPPTHWTTWAFIGFAFLLTPYVINRGFSFVLSALIGTPGCEMRSIPHLWTLVTGRETQEHYCPGIIDTVDRWEAAGSSTGRSAG